MNGVEKYVKETTETFEKNHIEHWVNFFVKERLRMKSTIMLTPVSVLLRERKWVDANPGT